MFTLLLPGLPCSPPALATISWLLLTALWTSSTLAPAPSLATLWRMWARLSSSLHSAVCHHHYNNIVFIAPTCPRPPPWPRSPPPRARCRRPGCCQHLQTQLGHDKTSAVSGVTYEHCPGVEVESPGEGVDCLRVPARPRHNGLGHHLVLGGVPHTHRRCRMYCIIYLLRASQHNKLMS